MIISILTFIISGLLTALILPGLIKYFHSKHEGQIVFDKAPERHKAKNGVPTMGGISFILGSTLCVILILVNIDYKLKFVGILLMVWILFGLLGMFDDSIKLFNRQNDGLRAKNKFLLQLLIAFIFGILLFLNHFNTFGIEHFSWFYIIFIMFWLSGFSNAVNLTDGLDGLAAGLSLIAFVAYAFIAFRQNQLGVMVVCLAVSGSLVAFLFWNHTPAKIFMGDMGSLALGGLLSAISIVLHHSLSLLIIGGVFVIETLSVIVQITYFRKTGKRLFRMTPIHHHFEMMNWSEWKIDIIFWLVGIVLAIIGVCVF